jgi:hypothetical protein
MAKAIQDEKSKNPSDVQSIMLMIKNQAERNAQWVKQASTLSSFVEQTTGANKRKRNQDNVQQNQNRNAKKHKPTQGKVKTYDQYCAWCYKLRGQMFYGHLAADCTNNPNNASASAATSSNSKKDFKKQRKVIADSGASESLKKSKDLEIAQELEEYLQQDTTNKNIKEYFSLIKSLHNSTPHLPLTRTFQGFNGSTQIGFKGGELQLSQSLSIPYTYRIKDLKDEIASISQINDLGNITVFTKDSVLVIPYTEQISRLIKILAKQCIAEGNREDGIYYFDDYIDSSNSKQCIIAPSSCTRH